MIEQKLLHLTEGQRKLFWDVQLKRMKGMGSDMQKKYDSNHIKKVEWNKEEDCLHVHFDDGEWWHYCKDGTWY